MAEKKQPTAAMSLSLACGTALIAVNFTHPIETVKTRLQIGNFNFAQMRQQEGLGALFKGIQAAWLREASYTTVKLGGYPPIREAIGANKKDAPFALKFAAGSMSGSIGSVVGNPFDVMKTMMMGNTKEAVPLSVLMQRMFKDQGIAGFYRGVTANMTRACILNGTKMSCYDAIKGFVVTQTGWERKDIRCMFASATGAGFFMTCTVAPADNLRTRLMNQPTDKKIYNGLMDAAVKVVRSEGPMALYRGFFPMWGRFAPQATLQLVIFDNLLTMCGFSSI